MAVKKRTKAPTVKEHYGRWWVGQLERKMDVPTKRIMVIVEEYLGRTGWSPEKLNARIENFAAKHGVDVSDVKIFLDYTPCIRTRRPESDEDFNRRVKYAEDFNRQRDRWLADKAAVAAWEKEQNADLREREREARAAARATAHAELVAEEKESIRANARAMRKITDEVLDDENFINSLKKLFTS